MGFSLKKGGLVRCKLNGNNQNLQVMYLLFLRWSSFRQKMKTNVYNSQKSDVMSELALANVEALAESELSQKCGDCSTDKQVYCCTLVIEGLGTFTLNKD